MQSCCTAVVRADNKVGGDWPNPFFAADTTLSGNQMQQLDKRGRSDDVFQQCRGGGGGGVNQDPGADKAQNQANVQREMSEFSKVCEDLSASCGLMRSWLSSQEATAPNLKSKSFTTYHSDRIFRFGVHVAFRCNQIVGGHKI
jgi:hypothetical protein